jgi:hypothetical protein
LRDEWAGGGYWYAPQWQMVRNADTAPLFNDGNTATYLRAYLRLMAWEHLLGMPQAREQLDHRVPAPPVGNQVDRKFYPYLTWHDRGSPVMWRRAMRDLAREYLYEWRENATLPPVESILLARA